MHIKIASPSRAACSVLKIGLLAEVYNSGPSIISIEQLVCCIIHCSWLLIRPTQRLRETSQRNLKYNSAKGAEYLGLTGKTQNRSLMNNQFVGSFKASELQATLSGGNKKVPVETGTRNIY